MPTRSGSLLVASGFGVSRSTDFGETFEPPFNAVAFSPREQFSGFWVAPSGPLIGAGSQGVWRSDDDGVRWTERNQGLSAMPISSLAVAAAGPESLVVFAGRGVYRSGDRGTTWRRLYTDLEEPYVELGDGAVMDPRFPRTLYALGSDGFLDLLGRSRDGGRTWAALPFPYGSCGGSICELSMSALALDPRRPERLYLGGYVFFHFGPRGNFLFRSDDGFETSTLLHPLEFPSSLVIDPNDGTLFGLTCRRLYRSRNEAESWQRVGLGLPEKLCAWAPVLAVGPGAQPKVYVATRDRGVFVSTNAGATFSPMNSGLETASVSVLAVDPSEPTKLYAGVSGRGVFAWNSKRRIWEALNEGLPIADFGAELKVDPRHSDVLYAGTAQGLFRIDLGAN